MNFRNLLSVTKVFALLFALISEAAAQDGKICEFYFEGCPEDYTGDTIVMPPYIVGLSQNVYVCEPSEVIEFVIDSLGGPPSIVFIIDHSFSMMGLGSIFPGRDTYGARFRVTEDIIDTIFSVHPTAEISIVVFREKLYFDHNNYSHFNALPGFGDGSYLPLMKLNANQTGGQTGLEVVHEVLRNDTVVLKNTVLGGFDVECVDLTYKPVFATIGNTNINCAFAAAKEAMKSSSYPKRSQFFIFMSDGVPHKGENDPIPYEFVSGADCPTTFTVFFDPNGVAPDSLIQMNKNIQNNGYSTLNPKSQLWAVDANYDTLMTLLMLNVINSFVLELKSKPNKLTVNSSTSTSITNQFFAFTNKFNLQEDLTYFEFDIDYTVTNSKTGTTYDTTTSPFFWVKRDPSIDTLPDDFGEWCWNRSMSFYYNGNPVTSVNETMEQLEIRFEWDPGDAGYVYTDVPVEITHEQNSSPDSENFTLTNSGTYFTYTFPRTLDAINKGDNTLQHAPIDEIVAIFRNPEIPLDTLRVSVPFRISASVEVLYGTYFDNNADGYVDSIPVLINGTFDPTDLDTLAKVIALPPHRNFTVLSKNIISGGISLIVSEGTTVMPRTFITSLDSLTISSISLPQGGLLVGGTSPIIDSMAPVINSAHLTDILGSSVHDTLAVIFSEIVAPITQKQPFYFMNPVNKIQYYAQLHRIADDDKMVTFWVEYLMGINNEVIQTMERGDSIWINPIPQLNVFDNLNNQQQNPLNIRRLLDNKLVINPILYVINTTGIVDPNTVFIIPPVVVNTLNLTFNTIEGGMVIMINPNIPDNMMIGEKLEAKVSIYDCVGNLVRKIPDEHAGFYNGEGDKTKIAFFVLWNSRNENDRKVGSGAYVLVADIFRIDRNDRIIDKAVKKILIGVKRD